MLNHLLGVFVGGLMLSGVNFQNASQSSITAISIAGIWESDRCDVLERNGRRTSSRSVFVFLDGEWALEFTQYSDAACTTPSLRAFFDGRYRIAEPSSAVAGAYHATFGFSTKRLTLYDDDLYGIGVNVVRPGSESRARSVGRQLTAQAEVRSDDHLTLTITITAFAAGHFLRETPPAADVAYVAVSSTYRF